MTDYKPLPTLEPAIEGETLQGYGIRILTFVLNTGVTCTLSDSDLELADHVYPLAISGKEISVLAVDKLSAVRHLILGAIRTRKAIDLATAKGQPACSVPPTGGAQPGKHATLSPQPKVNPPANRALSLADTLQF